MTAPVGAQARRSDTGGTSPKPDSHKPDSHKPDARRPGKDGPAVENLFASLGGVAAPNKARPVEDWNPPFCGHLDMRIARDGTWFYQGTPIGRPALVKLFASILRKDPDGYVLVTPVERVGLQVEDVPFLAVEMIVEGEGKDQRLHFRTNVDDVITAGPEHPLRFETGAEDGLTPYVKVRGELWARLTRPLLYDLVERAEEEPAPAGSDHAADEVMFGIWSGGRFFPIAPASAIEGL